MFHVPDQPRGLVPEDADLEAGLHDGITGAPRAPSSSPAYHEGYAHGVRRRVIEQIDGGRTEGG